MPTPQDFNDFEPSAPAESGPEAETPRRGVAHTAAATPAGRDRGDATPSSPVTERDGASLAPSPGTPEADPVAFQQIELPPLPAAYQEFLDTMERGRREIQNATGLDQMPDRTASSVVAALRATGAQDRLLERTSRSVGMIPEARRDAAALAQDPAVHWEPWAPEPQPSRWRRLVDGVLAIVRDVVRDDAGARAPGRS